MHNGDLYHNMLQCYLFVRVLCWAVDEDKWLEHYLVMNKNSVERAKTSLDKYFSLRWVQPDMFQDRDFASPSMNSFFANT